MMRVVVTDDSKLTMYFEVVTAGSDGRGMNALTLGFNVEIVGFVEMTLSLHID